VTLRARWVTLRARWVTLRARWVTLRARWVTLRARWVTLRARWVTLTQFGRGAGGRPRQEHGAVRGRAWHEGAYANPTQVCVNPTQVYVNPTPVCVNPTPVYVNPTQVVCVNPTQVHRHEEFASGCEATCNGPYGGAWSKTMVGYGSEDTNFCLELTCNYGVCGLRSPPRLKMKGSPCPE
jgi:hypothetical protein